MPRKSRKDLPVIAITMGDPCGIGPEVIVKAFDSARFRSGCIPLVVGDRAPMERAIGLLGSGYTLASIHDGTGWIPEVIFRPQRGVIPILSRDVLTPADIEYGRPSPAACDVTVSSIAAAVKMVQSNMADAICTCPVNKAKLYEQGFSFPGHTEYLQDLTGAKDVVMMLAGPKLRVSLATIHEALADVPALLTKDRLRTAIRITAEAMVRDFAVKSPRIAIAGLNPHAGEAGKFGREELTIIGPVVEEFRVSASPWQVSGPWPPDTLFHRAWSGEFDAVVAMYHDQGLIPIKLAHFDNAVNVSLGLPIVRTSVDHGTAYDIAGTGKADPGSLIAAVKLASSIVENRLEFERNLRRQ